MTNLLKKTISIPEDLYSQIKILAATQGNNFSSFLVKILTERIKGKRVTKRKVDPMSTLGVFSLGGKLPYKHREDLYDDYIKEKMGF